MLRPAITLYALIVCYNALAQNWQLFPVNQLNHYIVGTEKPAIRSFQSDSVLTIEQSQIYFFNRYIGSSKECYRQNYRWLYGYGKGFFIDSLVYCNDSVVYYFLDGDLMYDFVFKPMAMPGDEWFLSSQLLRKGTCTGIGISDVLGESDSVRSYTLQTVLGDVEFLLSKTHGLIQFIPFTYFFVEIPIDTKDAFPFEYYKILGFQKNDEIKGFSMPGFSDYFHLSAGDQLLWKHTFYNSEGLTARYYKDSLVSSSIYSDSVVYEMQRYVYDSSGLYIRNTDTIITYEKLRYEYLLQTPAMWYTTHNEVNNGEIFFIEGHIIDFIDEDTIHIKEYSADGCYFDTYGEPCYVTCVENLFYRRFKVSNIEGFIYFKSTYGDTKELCGSVVDGKLRGSMSIPPLGIKRINNYNFNIYPNPNSGEYIMVDLTDMEELLELIIVDINGKVILRTSRIQNNIIRLNLDLNNGIYFMKVVSNNYTYNSKFVVQ